MFFLKLLWLLLYLIVCTITMICNCNRTRHGLANVYFHLCMKLLFICYCHCEACLRLGKVLYKLNIIILLLPDERLVSMGQQCARSVQSLSELLLLLGQHEVKVLEEVWHDLAVALKQSLAPDLLLLQTLGQTTQLLPAPALQPLRQPAPGPKLFSKAVWRSSMAWPWCWPKVRQKPQMSLRSWTQSDHTPNKPNVGQSLSLCGTLPTLKHNLKLLYVTLDHKTGHKGQFFEIVIYTSAESRWCMVCYDWTNLSEIQLFVNLESGEQKKSKYWENHL